MPSQLVAREESLLNVLVEGAQGDPKEGGRLLGVDEAIMFLGFGFVSRRGREPLRPGRAEESERGLTISPSAGFQLHTDKGKRQARRPVGRTGAPGWVSRV